MFKRYIVQLGVRGPSYSFPEWAMLECGHWAYVVDTGWEIETPPEVPRFRMYVKNCAICMEQRNV